MIWPRSAVLAGLVLAFALPCRAADNGPARFNPNAVGGGSQEVSLDAGDDGGDDDVISYKYYTKGGQVDPNLATEVTRNYKRNKDGSLTLTSFSITAGAGLDSVQIPIPIMNSSAFPDTQSYLNAVDAALNAFNKTYSNAYPPPVSDQTQSPP